MFLRTFFLRPLTGREVQISLAFKSFEANQEFEIVTDKPVQGKITVTHLQHSREDGYNFYFATSHSNIEKGKHMMLKGKNGPNPQSTGHVSVFVSDVNFVEHKSLSCRITATGFSTWHAATSTVEFRATTFTDVSRYVVTLSNGSLLRQKVLNNVKPEDSYSFSFYEMDPFDKTVDFTFPQSNNVSLQVSASESDASLSLNRHDLIKHYSYQSHTTLKAGYINSLTNYETRLTLVYPDYTYEYKNFGSIPEGNVAWPQLPDFNISEKPFTNFSATSSKPYVWRDSRWSYSDPTSKTSILWYVSSSLESQSIKELPTEITSTHPILSLNNLKHTSTTFYTQSPPFESMVDKDFATGQEPEGLQVGIKISTE